MKRKYFLVALIGICFTKLIAQNPSYEERMQWFTEAKLGIFIHWGYYGVNGITESWSLYHKRITHDQYMKQGEEFTAATTILRLG